MGGGAAGRAAAAMGFFFFATSFFAGAAGRRSTRTGLGASRGPAAAPSASGRTDTVCGW